MAIRQVVMIIYIIIANYNIMAIQVMLCMEFKVCCNYNVAQNIRNERTIIMLGWGGRGGGVLTTFTEKVQY